MNLDGWVQVITQIVTTVTAVVMAVLAYVNYLRPPEQATKEESDKAVDEAADEELSQVLVFKTSKQQTWFTATDQGIECRIDDTRPGRGGLQWVIPKRQAREILKMGTFFVNPGYKARTGTFTLGPKRNWLYSKSLFPEPEYLRGVLRQLLEGASS